jgi:hypothetical protein
VWEGALEWDQLFNSRTALPAALFPPGLNLLSLGRAIWGELKCVHRDIRSIPTLAIEGVLPVRVVVESDDDGFLRPACDALKDKFLLAGLVSFERPSQPVFCRPSGLLAPEIVSDHFVSPASPAINTEAST